MIRNIVFDMGMVLMDFHPLAACRAAAPDEDGAQKLHAAVFAHPEWAGLDDGTLTEAQLAQNAMARLADTRLRALVPEVLGGMPYNVLSPIPGMKEVTDRLIARGFRVYLLSNAGLNVSEHREIVPGLDAFHGVVFSVEEKVVKPDPEIYRRLTRRYGLAARECLFIDDVPRNVEGARALGWQGQVFDGDVPALRRMLETLPAPKPGAEG